MAALRGRSRRTQGVTWWPVGRPQSRVRSERDGKSSEDGRWTCGATGAGAGAGLKAGLVGGGQRCGQKQERKESCTGTALEP